MQTAIGIIIAILIFGLLVMIHEFGHFIVAKKSGVVVNEFSIGMGPRLLSRVAKSGTRYSLKAFPIGGSCAMLGEDEDNDEEGSFNSKSVWVRTAIVFAGPFANFLLAFALAIIVIGFAGTDPSIVTDVSLNSAVSKAVDLQGKPAGLQKGDEIKKYNGASIGIGRELYLEEFVHPVNGDEVTLTYKRNNELHTIKFKPDCENKYLLGINYSTGPSAPKISSVTKDSPVEKAGIASRDIVVSINDEAIKSGDDLAKYFKDHPLDGTAINMKVKRHGKIVNAKVVPEKTNTYSLGFNYNLSRVKQDFLSTMKYSLIEMRYQIMAVLKSLKMLITGGVSANEVSGPVGIVSVIGDTYKESASQGVGVTILSLLNLSILLSANLGVMNLLPIPALDGGRILIYIVEIVTRKRIPKDKEGKIHFVGFVILMLLMIFLVFNDVRKLIF